MTSKEKLEGLLQLVTKEEDRRTGFVNDCMEKGNTAGIVLHNAEASMCTKIRWVIEDLLNNEDGKMEFNEAYTLMKRGAKIKLPEWTGYWYWSEDRKTIVIHCKDGKELDIRETQDVGFTMDNILRGDWIEVK